jgi:hypothetical protein
LNQQRRLGAKQHTHLHCHCGEQLVGRYPAGDERRDPSQSLLLGQQTSGIFAAAACRLPGAR